MLKKYMITLVVFIAIDGLWLGLIAPKLYKAEIGHLMADKVNWVAALAFYLIYIVALLVFVINPALDKGSIKYALMYGALLGFAMYATYDLTNLATLQQWPVKITLIDLVWGSFVTAATCALSTKLISYFG